MHLSKSGLKASSPTVLKAGSIFSAFMSGGKLVRFLRINHQSPTGSHPGVVSIGPYWDEGEPFWYDDAALRGIYCVMDETAAIQFHVPVARGGVDERHLSTGVAGGIYITDDERVLLGVRHQIGRTVGAFVDIRTGEIDNKFNYSNAAFLDKYQLLADDESGKKEVIFDSKNNPQ
ncbi:MAG TPA: hypothetical protein VGG48_08320 [Rhizomicrobium sp.]